MSHPASTQPRPAVAASLDADQLAVVEQAIAQHRQTAGGLLPMLHQIQDALGHVPDGAVPLVANAQNLSRAEVHGVLTFYHHFRRDKAKGTVVQVCRAESCKACGSDALWEAAQALDGDISVAPVYCLGLCASSPAVQVGERCHARMTPERLKGLLSTGRAVA